MSTDNSNLGGGAESGRTFQKGKRACRRTEVQDLSQLLLCRQEGKAPSRDGRHVL